MVDEKRYLPATDNIKGLVQDLNEMLDARMVQLRDESALEEVRPSDAKVFMLAARHPRSVSAIARDLSISRQAAHMSVKRLMEKQVIALEERGNKREKIVVITPKGQAARKIVKQQLEKLERELAEKIGMERLQQLRELLRITLRGNYDE